MYLPDFPVYLDGLVRPMITLYDELLDAGEMPKALTNMVKNARRSPFFGEGDVRLTKNLAHRRQVISSGEPSVILASRGMLHAGPSVAYARQILTEEKSALLTVGYQDEESPGRRLRETARGDSLPPPLRMWRRGYSRGCGLCRVGRYHLSAHADRAGLLNLISDYPSPRVVLVHGEGGARLALYESLYKEREVVQARNGERVDLSSPPRFGKAARASTCGHSRQTEYDPEELDKSLRGQTFDAPEPSSSHSPRKVSRFNTHADVWVEDGMVLMELPENVDPEHLFPEGSYRMKIRRNTGGDEETLRAEIYPERGNPASGEPKP